jgi:hypothetical protein
MMNRAQRRHLKLYAHFRERHMSVLALFLFNWRVYVAILLAATITSGAMLYLQSPQAALVFAFGYALVVARDFGAFLRSSRTWPLVREVLDWPKVDSLINEASFKK